MAKFPLQLGKRRFGDLGELRADMERRGQSGITDNPGQMYPADHYLKPIREDENVQLAVCEAATELVARSSDPGVLLLCAHVGAGSHVPFFAAVLDRLEGQGAPIPDAPGAPGPRLVDDLHRVFGRPTVHADPGLRRRVASTLLCLGALEALITITPAKDPDGVMPGVAERYSQQPAVSALHVGLASFTIARSSPSALLSVAACFSGAELGPRQAFAAKVELANPGWFARQGDRLRRALGLPAGPVAGA